MRLMIKLLGAALLLISASLYGWLKSRELWGRRQELKYLAQQLAVFRSEVTYHHFSLGELFMRMSIQSREPYQEIFATIYRRMEQERTSFQEAWQEALTNIVDKTSLQEEDVQYMAALDRLADTVDERFQENVFGQVAAQMEYRTEQLETEYGQKGKVYCCMGITIGILGVIILI